MATMSNGWPGCGGAGDPGDFLLRQGTITHEELATARRESADPIQWLADQGILSEKTLYQLRAMKERMAYIDLEKVRILHDAYALPFEQALKIDALPFKKDGDNLWVAFKDAKDRFAIEEVERVSGCRVHPVIVAPSQIDAVFDQYRKNPSLWPSGPPSHDPGEMLVLKEYVTPQQLAQALEASADPVRWLLERDIIGEHEFATARAWEHRIAYMGFSDGSFKNKEPDRVPTSLARALGILPLSIREDTLCVAVADPRDWELVQHAEEATGLKIEPMFVMRARDLAEALGKEDE